MATVAVGRARKNVVSSRLLAVGVGVADRHEDWGPCVGLFPTMYLSILLNCSCASPVFCRIMSIWIYLSMASTRCLFLLIPSYFLFRTARPSSSVVTSLTSTSSSPDKGGPVITMVSRLTSLNEGSNPGGGGTVWWVGWFTSGVTALSMPSEP